MDDDEFPAIRLIIGDATAVVLRDRDAVIREVREGRISKSTWVTVFRRDEDGIPQKAADIPELHLLFHPEESPPEALVESGPPPDPVVPPPAEERAEDTAQAATDPPSTASEDETLVVPSDEALADQAGKMSARTRLLLESPAAPVPGTDSAQDAEMQRGSEQGAGCGPGLLFVVLIAGLLWALSRLVPVDSSGNASAVDINVDASNSAQATGSGPISASSNGPVTYPTSFACRRHMPTVERTICESPDLAAKDRAMALLYRDALQASEGDARIRTRAEQRRWLQARARCADAAAPSACLAGLYEERIAGLRRVSEGRNAGATNPPVPEEPPLPVASPSPPVDQPPPKPDLTQAATLLSGSVEPEDYPESAATGGFEGQTTVRFTVGVDGRVTACSTISSSGHSILDRQACSVIRRRFRFNPARDAEGLNVEDILTKTVTWKLRD